jgi:glycosyltransferase involved in cell wall biosynthesis
MAVRGHQVIFLNASAINQYRNGIQYISVTKEPWSYKSGGVRSKKQAIKFAYQTFNWLRRNPVDVVYSAATPILAIFGVRLGKFSSKSKQIIEWFEIWPLKYWIRYAGKLIGVVGWIIQLFTLQIGDERTIFTKRAENALHKLSFSLRKKNIVLLNGLCDEKIPIDFSQVANSRNDILFLGRFVNEKQTYLAIDCIEKFTKTGWCGHFWIIGHGPLAQVIQNYICERGLQERITILQNASNDRLQDILAKSFLLLHTSRREGYGLVVAEAAYRGVPAILINYPENFAIKLGISPDLVCETDDKSEIVNRIQYAFENQAPLLRQLEVWVRTASKVLSTTASVAHIERLFSQK